MKFCTSPCYNRTLSLSLVAIALLYAPTIQASETIWNGSISSDWDNSDNWSLSPPTVTDIAVIPVTSRQPQIDSPYAACAGLILHQHATVEVLESENPLLPNALYVIGPGDLDADGVSDAIEYARSVLEGSNFDVDGDGLPNMDDTDSDSDTMSDACEFANEAYLCPDGGSAIYRPYEPDDPDADCDGDGASNQEECEAGTDPTDADDIPVNLPISSRYTVTFAVLLLAGLSIWILRRSGPRGRRILYLLIAMALLSIGGYTTEHPLFADAHKVSYGLGQRIEEVAETASDGDTLNINGASDRPWNGGSTYLNKPRILRALGGPVFLGGMRSTLRVGMLGQGSLKVESVYRKHVSAVSATVVSGRRDFPVFLGERFTITATPESGWGFYAWSNGPMEGSNPLSFQHLQHGGEQVLAFFGPPGPDLMVMSSDGPSSRLTAGDAISIEIRVKNVGQSATTESTWKDGVYLSRDVRFDDSDYRLVEVTHTHSGAMDAGEDYTVTLTATMPDIAPGRYHLVIVTDAENDATDNNRINNEMAVSVDLLDANLAE